MQINFPFLGFSSSMAEVAIGAGNKLAFKMTLEIRYLHKLLSNYNNNPYITGLDILI